MRFVLCAVAGSAALLIAPAPAHADGEYLRVTPSTIQAGFQIEVEGYCGDDVNQAATQAVVKAVVKSEAFGSVTITPDRQPVTGKHLHRGTATIPTDKPAGAYGVSIACPGNRSATTTLNVVNYTVPATGPDTGGGALASKSLPGNAFTFAGAGAIALGTLLLLLRRRVAGRRRRRG